MNRDTIVKTITEITADKEYVFTMPAPVHFILIDLYNKTRSLGHSVTYLSIYYDILPLELRKKIKLEVKDRILN